MTENKTYSIELTEEEAGRLISVAYAYKGETAEGTELVRAAAMKVIEQMFANK